MESYRVGNYIVRSLHGYKQSREMVKGSKWLFEVSDFPSESLAVVVMYDGSRDVVSIDDENRITIRGRKYADSHWQH